MLGNKCHHCDTDSLYNGHTLASIERRIYWPDTDSMVLTGYSVDLDNLVCREHWAHSNPVNRVALQQHNYHRHNPRHRDRRIWRESSKDDGSVGAVHKAHRSTDQYHHLQEIRSDAEFLRNGTMASNRTESDIAKPLGSVVSVQLQYRMLRREWHRVDDEGYPFDSSNAFAFPERIHLCEDKQSRQSSSRILSFPMQVAHEKPSTG